VHANEPAIGDHRIAGFNEERIVILVHLKGEEFAGKYKNQSVYGPIRLPLVNRAKQFRLTGRKRIKSIEVLLASRHLHGLHLKLSLLTQPTSLLDNLDGLLRRGIVLHRGFGCLSQGAISPLTSFPDICRCAASIPYHLANASVRIVNQPTQLPLSGTA
jgi:hypothetical protein